MNNFLELLQVEFKESLESLAEVKSEVTYLKDKKISGDKPLISEIEFSNENDIEIILNYDYKLANTLNNLLFQDDAKYMEVEHLEDTLNEIFSNVFGPLSVVLSAQEKIPYYHFKRARTFNKFPNDIKKFKFQYVLKVVIDKQSFEIDVFSTKPLADETIVDEQVSDTCSHLLDNVDIQIKVRIGKKQLLLDDINKLKIGSKVEINKNVNKPLEILANNTVIGYGEIVVIDGHFGVQITSLINN